MKGMVVAPHSIAVEEGVKILRRGGNAVDAALTTAFVQCVVGVRNCGIAGFGSLHVYIADSGEEKIIDFHGKAGSKAKPDIWEDIFIMENRSGYGITLKGNVNDRGYQSIAVSGTIKAFHEAMLRYGTMNWKELIEPAIPYAKKGYPVSGEQAIQWMFRGPREMKFNLTKAAEEIYLKEGNLYSAGEILVQKDLGLTLDKIATHGPDVFYSGEIGEKIAQDLEEHNSLITIQDWKTPKVVISQPLTTEYRGYTISSNPAPGGGITLIEIFNILEGYPLNQYDWSGLGSSAIDHMHLVVSAFKAAQQDRVNFVGDPAFIDVPTKKLISKKHASKWRERINAGERISIPRRQGNEEASTTHISVVDSKGNSVSLTHSLSSGSGVVTPGLGFMYNSCMNCFDPIPGHPNSIAPGKSRITGIAPTLVFKDGELTIVIGAPGGNRIIGGIAQGIINIIDHRMSPVEAVSAPRIDCQWLDIVDVTRRIPSYLCDELMRTGHKVERSPFHYEFWPLVQAISINRASGKVRGGSDPRSGGIALSE
ncbi:MAG: gamma-glutamyltransferase [Candidatus Bathyarchaeota archaeon]|nr:MAG: gamma-glutamyltransferase [Candidatus Bathyarchaeota archaeon]